MFHLHVRGHSLVSKAYISVKDANPAGNYLLKVNNRNTRTRCEICSKITIKTLEQQQRQ